MKRLVIAPVGANEWRPEGSPAYLCRFDKVRELLARWSDPLLLAAQDRIKAVAGYAQAIASFGDLPAGRTKKIQVLADVYEFRLLPECREGTVIAVFLADGKIFKEFVREIDFWSQCFGALLVNWRGGREDWSKVTAIVVERRQRSIEVVSLGL
ncbi:hypothetical protein EPN83_00210 [Patescibacteria group bacterium]|nr:MAG: hypothetical protein EPN83_00210 [Patescibacteria group bacterium]